jgi:endonuclease/exonuclease/phosphatase family metal-dependent hydrolase
MSLEWGFAGARRSGIDHVLVRGLSAGEPQAWPDERRVRAGRLLSDHAPVEVEVA